jgi:hypothetical protein
VGGAAKLITHPLLREAQTHPQSVKRKQARRMKEAANALSLIL